MVKIVTIDAMRKIEAAADAAGTSYALMMERAGAGVAARAAQMLSGLLQARVTVLVGAGNNGGDGLVAGRILADETSTEVRFYLLKRRDGNDPNFKEVLERGLFMVYADDDRDLRVLRNMVASADLVIDALFGIGVRLPLKDGAARIMRTTNQAIHERQAEYQAAQQTGAIIHPTEVEFLPQRGVKVLAVDCPSGLDCDTGILDKNAIPADETITFIAAKPGLFLLPGANTVGRLAVASLGLPADTGGMDKEPITLAHARSIKTMLPERHDFSHKGTYGRTLIVSGSINYTGAAALAAKAAYNIGAGLVTVAAPHPVLALLAAQLLEPTWLPLPHDMGVIAESAANLLIEAMIDARALLVGPGLGQEETTGKFLKSLLAKAGQSQLPTRRSIGFTPAQAIDSLQKQDAHANSSLPPLIIDADGLNLLAKIENWPALLPLNSIITPHPGEMSRLTGQSVEYIQQNRWEMARQAAAQWKVIILLKGAHTVIAAPDGRMTILPFKTDALATAGTGDVLAGAIAGLVAQGAPAFEAAVCGGYLHGLAAEMAAQQFGSGRGVCAGDVLDMLPYACGMLDHKS